jgi:catalase-peroxidase
MDGESKCPFPGGTRKHMSMSDWWPNQVDLTALRQPAPSADPMGEAFNYA